MGLLTIVTVPTKNPIEISIFIDSRLKGEKSKNNFSMLKIFLTHIIS